MEQLDQSLGELTCSAYYLSSGTLNITWPNGTNSTVSDPINFPALYFTNCLFVELQELLKPAFQPLFEDAFQYRTTEDAGAVIAIAFTVCGICIASWMLTLFLYLLPRHKRKPWLTQLATIFFSIVSSILLSLTTDELMDEYEASRIDIFRLHAGIYGPSKYRISKVFMELFIGLALMQIMLHMSRWKWRWLQGAVYLLAEVAASIINLVSALQNNEFLVYDQMFLYSRRVVNFLIRMGQMTQLTFTLIYYMSITKAMSTTYLRPLLPLAFMTWFLVLWFYTLTITAVTYFHEAWYSYFWIEFIVHFTEIVLVTLFWEWILNVAILEKRQEMSDMLGRRLSIDDITSLKLAEGGVTTETGRHFKLRIRKLWRKRRFAEPQAPTEVYEMGQMKSKSKDRNPLDDGPEHRERGVANGSGDVNSEIGPQCNVHGVQYGTQTSSHEEIEVECPSFDLGQHRYSLDEQVIHYGFDSD